MHTVPICESTHEIIFVETIVSNIYVKIKHRRKSRERKKANFELFRDYEIEHSRFGHFKNSPQQNIHVSLNDWFCYLNVWTHLKRRNMFIVFFLTNIIFILTI